MQLQSDSCCFSGNKVYVPMLPKVFTHDNKEKHSAILISVILLHVVLLVETQLWCYTYFISYIIVYVLRSNRLIVSISLNDKKLHNY